MKKGDLGAALPKSTQQPSSDKREQPLSAISPDKRGQPLSAVPAANATPPVPAAELRDERSQTSPALSAAPVAWIANRMVDLTPRPSPLPALPTAITTGAGDHGQAAAPSPATAPANEVLTKSVKEGDCISRLIIDIYGYVDNKMIEVVKEYNPHIRDINMIKTGDLITFPKTPRMKVQPN
jgi:hypothetical protein